MNKIGRIALIPALIALIVWAVFDVQHVIHLKHESSALERSLNGMWPKAYAKFDKYLALMHDLPYPKGGAMTVFGNYTYTAQGQTCHGTRFEFSPQKGGAWQFPPTDRRLHDMIKKYCTGAPRKTDLKTAMRYEYSCYPIEVHYDPTDVCAAYIEKPLDPQASQVALKSAMTSALVMLLVKIALCGVCVWGLWPLLFGYSKKSVA